MNSLLARLIYPILRFSFYLLYQPLAGLYDAVAWLVSLGRWNRWLSATIPFLKGERILELGHGPGHLQKEIASTGRKVVGLDKSSQMGLIASRRLLGFNAPLVRAQAEQIPFRAGSFETIVATFPTEYIFELDTLREIRRTLCTGGRVVVLLAAWFTGKNLLDRAASLLFHLTRQVPSTEELPARLVTFLNAADFDFRVEWVYQDTDRIMLLILD